MRLLTPYLATAFAFAAIDMVWLGMVAKTFYRQELGALMANPINVPAALIFYLLFPVGLLIFAIEPARSVTDAAVRGALFGFFAYATYDLTNLATLKDWSLKLSMVDLAWGTALSASSATIGAIANTH
jgi:uncharacterized membrane protein